MGLHILNGEVVIVSNVLKVLINLCYFPRYWNTVFTFVNKILSYIYSTRKRKKPLSCRLKLTEIKLFLFISKERNAVGHNTNGGGFNGRKEGEI
ncbi:hypothetical protein DOE78_16970 [Bacillus sp. Y1]|nr:hypothetical protein DOE78_16970 [Bacillus sp. Y1]